MRKPSVSFQWSSVIGANRDNAFNGKYFAN